MANIEYTFLEASWLPAVFNGDLLEFGKYTAQKYSETVVASCEVSGSIPKSGFKTSGDARRGSRRNGDRFPKQQTPKAQGSRGDRGTLSREFCFRVTHEKLTDFRKTVETGMDPRLDAILGDSLLTPRTPFTHASEHT